MGIFEKRLHEMNEKEWESLATVCQMLSSQV